jgi:hypothetical protein
MEGIQRRGPAGLGSIVLIAAFWIAAAGSAAADEVTAKGTALQGKVTGLGASGVTFEPEYGKGSLDIKWEDITEISTEGNFHVLHSEDQAIAGRIQGLRDGKLLVGDTPDTATGVDIESIFMGVALTDDVPSFQDRVRAYWRYWDGHFDLGFNAQQATTDTIGFLVDFGTVRTKDPWKFTLGAGYRYSTQNKKEKVTVGSSTFTDHTKSRIEDLAYGLVRGDYLITERVYTFASGDATYDSIQELSIRAVPQAGVGYVIYKEKVDETTNNFLQAEVGGGWVYEKYFGGDDRDYFTIIFGALAEYHLPYGAVLGWKFAFLPAVDDFTGDYLVRNDAYLGVPIFGPISAKLGLRDAYDSTPAPGTDKNSLYFTAGLSLGW